MEKDYIKHENIKNDIVQAINNYKFDGKSIPGSLIDLPFSQLHRLDQLAINNRDLNVGNTKNEINNINNALDFKLFSYFESCYMAQLNACEQAVNDIYNFHADDYKSEYIKMRAKNIHELLLNIINLEKERRYPHERRNKSTNNVNTSINNVNHQKKDNCFIF